MLFILCGIAMKTLLPLLFLTAVFSFQFSAAQTTLTPLWARTGLPTSSSVVNFTPDGKYLVSGGYYEQTVKIWDAATGKPYWSFGGSTYSSTQTFSKDGNIMAVTATDGSLTVVDIAAKRKVFSQITGAQYSTLSRDGKRVYILTVGRLLRIWDIESGTVLREFVVNSDNYSAPVLSGDGKYLLIRGSDRRIYIYDAETGAFARSFLVGPYGTSILLATLDGKYCLTSGTEQTLRVWRIDSGTMTTKFPIPYYLTSLQFTNDGSTLVINGYDSTATFISSTDWQKIRTQKFPAQSAFTLHPNSKQYVTNEGTFVKFYEITTGKYLQSIDVGKPALYSRISPNGSLLLTSASDTAIQVRQVPEGELRYQIIGHRSRIAALGFSADGKKLYSAESGGFTFTNDADNGTILGGKMFAARCNQPDATGDQTTRAVAMRGDSNLIYIGSGCSYRDPDNVLHNLQNINCYNIITGEERYAMDAETEPYILTGGATQPRYSPLNRMMVNNNGRYLATVGNADANIGIWNTDLRELRKRIGTHDYGFRSYAFSDNGEYIVTTSFQEVKLWDAPTGSLQNTISGMADWVDAATVSSNGNLIATQSGAEIAVWDALTEIPYRRFWLDTNVAGTLMFSPNGRYLVFCGRNIRVWHLSSIAETAASDVFGQGSLSNLYPLQATFSSDSRKLAVGGNDGGITVFELGETILSADDYQAQHQGLTAFPQPADAAFSIMLPTAATGTYTLTISDNLGKTVYADMKESTPADGIIRVDAHNLPTGIYACAISSGSRRFSVPVIISR